MASHYLAFDIGASSGRAILGTFAEGKLVLEELHRFENGAVDVNGGLFWNLMGLFQELKSGLKKALATGVKLSGVGIDTWGVDFALLDANGMFMGFPRQYRDPRNGPAMDALLAAYPREELYARTGLQFMPFNTIFQLAAMRQANDPALRNGRALLFMPNALTYLFTGTVAAEYTIASTSQLLDPKTRRWARDVARRAAIPTRLLPKLVKPGTPAGQLRPALCEELNCQPVPFYFSAGHDTAAAVAAVPAAAGAGRDWAYLSSGTWSLLGMELDQPCVSEEARRLDYTNEGGVGGKIRFLKNIMGLWLVQECRSQWRREGREHSFVELNELSAAATPFRSFVNPNNPVFLTPGDMPARLQDYCRQTGQPVPETPGAIIRCAHESLALRYRQTVEELEQLSGQRINTLYLVGGGSQNQLLNRLTTNAVQRTVVTGPVEATAMGNLLVQIMGAGELRNLKEIRQVVRASTETGLHQPEDAAAWEAAYQRFRALP